MTIRTLGYSDLRITPLGIGAWAMGGGNWKFGWGAQDDSDSIAAIHAGLDCGMNWVDTAAVYGLGHSETVIGRALRGCSMRPYVFTKCSLVWDESGRISHNLQPASIYREAEGSLKRLGLDAIDLYQIHWPAWRGIKEPDSRGAIEEAVEALTRLQAQGKIRYIGLSNFSAEQIRRAKAVAPIASVQSPYSLVATDVEFSILPYAKAQRIGVLAYSAMASGLLSGAMTRERIASLPENDWRKHSFTFEEPALSRNLRIVEILRDIGDRLNATPGEVAIAWTLRNPVVAGTIVGVRNDRQVREIAHAADVRLDVGDITELCNGPFAWVA